jgi:hypothetical protein
MSKLKVAATPFLFVPVLAAVLDVDDDKRKWPKIVPDYKATLRPICLSNTILYKISKQVSSNGKKIFFLPFFSRIFSNPTFQKKFPK